MRKTGPGLASIVVKLHQTEDQVCRHELKFIWWVCDNITEKKGRKKEKKRKQVQIYTKKLFYSCYLMNICPDFCVSVSFSVYIILAHITPTKDLLMSDISFCMFSVAQSEQDLFQVNQVMIFQRRHQRNHPPFSSCTRMQ